MVKRKTPEQRLEGAAKRLVVRFNAALTGLAEDYPGVKFTLGVSTGDFDSHEPPVLSVRIYNENGRCVYDSYETLRPGEGIRTGEGVDGHD